MKPCVLNQLNVISYLATHIMDNAIKTRYFVTFNNFMEWHFCGICVYYNNLKPNLWESHWSIGSFCTALKDLCLQFVHYHTHNDEQKVMLLTSKKRQNIPRSLNRTLYNYTVTKTVQSTRNWTRICVCELCTTKISWHIRLTLLLNRIFPILRS